MTQKKLGQSSNLFLRYCLHKFHVPILCLFEFCQVFLQTAITWSQDVSATDNWMDQVVNKGNKTKKLKTTENLFEEFDRFFGTEPIPCDVCLDIISWFGVGLI